MKKAAILLFFVIILVFLIQGFIQRQFLSYTEKIFILEDLYKQGITNYLGKTVFIKTRLYGYDEGRKQPYIQLENAEKYIDVSNSKVNDEAKKYAQRDVSRAQINLVSQDFKVLQIMPQIITRYIPIYYHIFLFRNKLFWNNLETVVVKGQIRYRSWLKMSEENAKNPVIIKQNNNPLYWNQVFEIVVDDLY